MKKTLMLIMAGALLAGAIVIAKPVDTQAALSCTYDIINDANAKIVAAQNAYNLAVADEANCKAAFEAVKSQGPASLAYVQAANAYESAQNRTRYAYDQITNAKAYLANIRGRETVEDDYLNAVASLGVLNNVQAAEQDAKNAQDIANSAALQIKNIQNAILGYQQQLATCPSVQAQIDALNVQLAALTADYNNKQAVANQKLATFKSLLAAGGYQNYDSKYINYINNRGKFATVGGCTSVDFYNGTTSCKCGPDCSCNNLGCDPNGCPCCQH